MRLRKELMNARHRKNVERCPGDDKSRLLLLSTAVKDPDTLEGEEKRYLQKPARASVHCFSVVLFVCDFLFSGRRFFITRAACCSLALPKRTLIPSKAGKNIICKNIALDCFAFADSVDSGIFACRACKSEYLLHCSFFCAVCSGVLFSGHQFS